ncbi:MAG: hypothetical protein IJM30_12235 [Thermoguttaceae bacterium]|nr:hypothetical protein [Thermoguttaceae bacterium]
MKRRDQRAPQTRKTRFESLEDRALLSVSTAEYEAIRAEYPELALPETAKELNVVDVDAAALTCSELQALVDAAAKTTADELIVVRTSSSARVLALEGNPIRIAADSELFGAVSIVGFSGLGEPSVPLVVDTGSMSRAFSISSSRVGLANMELVGETWVFDSDADYGGLIRAHRSVLTTVDLEISLETTDAQAELYESDYLAIPEESSADASSSASALPSIVDEAPAGASAYDGSLYMLGNVRVTLVLMESNGTIDVDATTWSEYQINQVKKQVRIGLDWWESYFDKTFPDSKMDISFTVDYQYANNPFETSYEPINRTSKSENLWIGEFLTARGIEGDYSENQSHLDNFRFFNETVRVAANADWAVSVVVANSRTPNGTRLNSGKFTNGSFAYTWRGGPSVNMTYDNNGWTIARMGNTLAHELGHAFWALDEYSVGHYDDFSGYYGIQNYNAENNPAPGFVQQSSIMAGSSIQLTAFPNLQLSDSGRETIGWRDSDSDGILDVLDLEMTLENPIGVYDAAARAYSFSATSRPVALENLIGYYSTGNDSTLNAVEALQYRVDGGAWKTATFYDRTQTLDENWEPIEYFVDATGSADLSELESGEHSIQWRTYCVRSGVASELFEDVFTVAPARDFDLELSTSEPFYNRRVLVGVATPGASVDSYRWYRLSEDGNETLIEGATSASYLPTADDVGFYLKVVATGSDDFDGAIAIAISANPVKRALSSITLTAATKVGTPIRSYLTPSAATVEYQWYRGTDPNDVSELIEGATSKDYAPTEADEGQYLKVVATACGNYVGEAARTTKIPVPGVPFEVALSINDPICGKRVNATVVTPGARASAYQWYLVADDGSETLIDGATGTYYVPTNDDLGFRLKVVATGKWEFESKTGIAVTANPIKRSLSSLVLTGATKVGTPIRSYLTPSAATVEYQWYRGTDPNDVSEPIEGATSKDYAPTQNDEGYYLKVVASAYGNYLGEVARTTKTAVPGDAFQIALSASDPLYNKRVNATVVTPGASAGSYQWYLVAENGGETLIEGATSAYYIPTNDDLGYRLKVVATGKGEFASKTGVAVTANPVKRQLASITLTAATKVGTPIRSYLTPSVATVAYQWYRGTSPDDVSELIEGATSKDYAPTEADEGYYLKVVATGYGNYVGEAARTAKTAVPSSSLATLDEDDDLFDILATSLLERP